MIFKQKLMVTVMLLFINNLALAANVDFTKIYNNASENCTDNNANCANADSLDSTCALDKSNDAFASNEAGKNEPCLNVETEKKIVEPKFSTKRPRGQ